MSNLQEMYQLIDGCIQQLGMDPATTKGKNPGSWILKKGTATVYIDVWYIEAEARSYFQVLSPVMKIPADRKETFYLDLLSFNDKLFSCAFAIHNDWAWIKMIREAEGLDAKEALGIINRVGIYADKYDDLLKEHYATSAIVEKANADGSGGRK